MNDDLIKMVQKAHKELVTEDYPGHLGQLDPWTMRLLERFAAIVADRKFDIAMAESYRCGYEAGQLAEREQWSALAEAAPKAARVAMEIERERCAKLMDDMALQDKATNYYKVAANAIRARGET